MRIEIKSKRESELFGEKLGELCFEGMCITLNGDLAHSPLLKAPFQFGWGKHLRRG